MGVMTTISDSCINYFSPCCDQIPDQKWLNGWRGFCFLFFIYRAGWIGGVHEKEPKLLYEWTHTTANQQADLLSASEIHMFLQCSWSHNISDLMNIGTEDLLKHHNKQLGVQRKSKRGIQGNEDFGESVNKDGRKPREREAGGWKCWSGAECSASLHKASPGHSLPQKAGVPEICFCKQWARGATELPWEITGIHSPATTAHFSPSFIKH